MPVSFTNVEFVLNEIMTPIFIAPEFLIAYLEGLDFHAYTYLPSQLLPIKKHRQPSPVFTVYCVSVLSSSESTEICVISLVYKYVIPSKSPFSSI